MKTPFQNLENKKKILLSLPSFRQNEGRENSFWINFKKNNLNLTK